MADRKKVMSWLEGLTENDWRDYHSDSEVQNIAKAAFELLKEQEEREKGICKKICDFIRRSCSVDTEADKECVCHAIQQIFIKGWRG